MNIGNWKLKKEVMITEFILLKIGKKMRLKFGFFKYLNLVCKKEECVILKNSR
jgi:hypothetical protein